MTSVPSATTWGTPTSTKHALLIHGLTSSSHTWHRVASTLAAQGYFVTAPNLIGHGSRVATDYRMSSMAEDLRPYIATRNYSLIIGHSMGTVTTLALLSYLSPSYPTAIVLVDPPLQVSPEEIKYFDEVYSDSCINVKPAEVYNSENPLWTREDSVYRELGTRLCSAEVVHAVLHQNNPWNFIEYVNRVSRMWKMTVLLADPAIFKICPVESILPYLHLRHVVVPGAGHWIQYEFPEVIVNEALKTVAAAELVNCEWDE